MVFLGFLVIRDGLVLIDFMFLLLLCIVIINFEFKLVVYFFVLLVYIVSIWFLMFGLMEVSLVK